jgi:hypothetical protein
MAYRRRSYGRRSGFKRRRTYGRKTYKKRSYSRKTSRRRPFGGQTTSKYIKFQYYTTLTVTSGTNVATAFAANNALDPGFTWSTTAATGVTDWALLYSRCIVLGCKFHVQLINNSSVGVVNCRIYPNYAAAAIAVPDSQKYTRRGILGQQGSSNKLTLNEYISTASIWGVSKKIVADDPASDYSTSMISGSAIDPAKVWYWILHTSAIDPAVGTLSYEASVRMVMYCKLKNQRLVLDNT